MMHVFLVVHDFSGAQTYSDQLAIYLSNRNDFRVYKVYLGNMMYSEFCVIRKNNIDCVYIPKNSIKKYDVRYYDRAALLMYAKFKDLKTVVFHLNAQEQFWFGENLKKLFNCPIIYTLHFLNAFYSFIEKTNMSYDFSENVLFGRTIDLADHIICVTSFAQRTINKFFKIEDSKTTHIYNGMSQSSDVSETSRTVKCKYGFSAEDRLILYAGQLEPRKGIDKLIQAFLIIKEKFPTSKLIIAGSGEYDNYLPLAQTCMGKISFVGKLDKETLFAFYNFCEVGVIPSQFEQCSYVALEMMCQKLSLIVTDVPGLNELVIHRQIGFVCKTKASGTLPATIEADETDLAIQLEYLLKNPSGVRAMAEKAFTWFLDRHTLKSMGEKTIEVYNKLINLPHVV